MENPDFCIQEKSDSTPGNHKKIHNYYQKTNISAEFILYSLLCTALNQSILLGIIESRSKYKGL